MLHLSRTVYGRPGGVPSKLLTEFAGSTVIEDHLLAAYRRGSGKVRQVADQAVARLQVFGFARR